MKFYKDTVYRYNSYWHKIYFNKLTAIHADGSVRFIKNGLLHNNKNAAYIDEKKLKTFSLNDKTYGNKDYFTKKSWRRFVKMQVFK